MRPIIFVLNSAFPYYSGGRENWVWWVSTKLAALGHPVSVMALAPAPESTAHYRVPDSVSLVVVRRRFSSLIGRVVTARQLAVLRQFVNAFDMRTALKRWVARQESRPVVVTLDTVFTPLASRAVSRDATIVCASKGPHAEVLSTRFPYLARLFESLERRAYRECDELWSNGADMQEYIRHQGFESELVGNGVDIERACASHAFPAEYEAARNSTRIAVIGSLLPIKGVDYAVDAVAKLAREAPECDAQLFFVGKGMTNGLRERANSLGIGDKVHFVGAKRDVFPYLAHASVVLCLSGGGGLSMALLEAMATGTPIVAWDSAVYRQVLVHAQNAMLAREQDVASLTSEILRLLRLGEEEQVTLGRRAREAARAHDWDSVVGRIHARIESLHSSGRTS